MKIITKSFEAGTTLRSTFAAEEIEVQLPTGRLTVSFTRDGQVLISGSDRINILPATECQVKVELRTR